MISDEIRELNRYMRLSSFRDDEYFLQDEYEELEDIIERNNTAKYLEEVRYQYLTGQITKEEYDDTCDRSFNKLRLRQGRHRSDE